MKNRKGFTLIELLAVIVILAIIMVIAVPQILNVINNSRKSAWVNSVKMIENSLELNTTLFNPSSGAQTYTIDSLCATPANVSNIADVGDMTITCNTSTKVFTLTGKNQFSGRTATITCTAASSTGTNVNCVNAITANN